MRRRRRLPSPGMRRAVFALLCTLAALLGVAPVSPALSLTTSVTGTAGQEGQAGQEPSTSRQYQVDGPATVAQRSAVARTGAAVDEVHGRSMVVTATLQEADAIRRLGFTVTELAPPAETGGPQTVRLPRRGTPATTTTPSSARWSTRSSPPIPRSRAGSATAARTRAAT
ncbi:hypothetical protein [Microbispora sp. GKU 823]|uniref:hypothetical protein n=1 Tax=Microbispora sp. GKU 823 TaxID=1652100 RepID=UPI0021172EEA|nr:hypothetical protein [Microbispora sp. GKU 823]